MTLQHSRFILMMILLGFLIVTGASRTQQSVAVAAAPHYVYLPLISTPPPTNPFGVNISSHSGDQVLQYAAETRPRWARAGDVLWSKIEPVRGAGYDWSSVQLVDANVRRLRASGIEPMLIIQQSPSWAQSVPGRACSPPKPEAVDDLARFVAALAARYAHDDLTVNYWEFWNEPDVRPQDVADTLGVGCWADDKQADFGGSYYGDVVRRITPLVKQANPHAILVAGGLLYNIDYSSPAHAGLSALFLKGMLASGAGSSFDALSFHAYGEYGAGDVLLIKTLRIRSVLQAYGLLDKPLFATEIAAMCYSNDIAQCTPNYTEWITRQANFAARIYAEALALDLSGAFWFTLAEQNPGFRYSQLIDDVNGTVTPRPAYYAFRTSSRLLSGVHYVGPPLTTVPALDSTVPQVLTFRKPRSTVYVLWVPRLDYPTTYRLAVPAGAVATCTQRLDAETPINYYCSDTDKNGIIPLAISSLPIYVEVAD